MFYVMSAMLQSHASLASGNFTHFAVKLENSSLVKLFRAKCRSLENILEVFLLKIVERQNTMFFVFPQDVVRVYTILAPKLATVKTITCIIAFLIAVSTSHFRCVTFFDRQNIEQVFQVEAIGQSFHAATLGNSHFNLAQRTFDLSMAGARPCQVVQTFKAEDV